MPLPPLSFEGQEDMKTTAASTPTDTEKIQIDAKSRLGAAFGIDLNCFRVGRGACGRRLHVDIVRIRTLRYLSSVLPVLQKTK